MTIRSATEQDIPAIVDLLKLSLGESLMPKSEAFWRWKHIDNPFGKSPVLLAFEGEQLIGIRAFMRWAWTKEGSSFKAVRAVDTATHPQYHGRGIFKRLTMQLVEQCREEGVDFIFNTPNKSSMPGYLKMGWESRGPLPVKMKLHLSKRLFKKVQVSSDWEKVKSHPWWGKGALSGDMLKTKITPEYLYWRYRDNPNVNYQLLVSDQDRPFILIYRKKKISRLTELRITELLCKSEHASFAIRCLQSTESASLMTISGCDRDAVRSGFITVKAGPTVTVRNLNLPNGPETLSFATWSPSLGDLELF